MAGSGGGWLAGWSTRSVTHNTLWLGAGNTTKKTGIKRALEILQQNEITEVVLNGQNDTICS